MWYVTYVNIYLAWVAVSQLFSGVEGAESLHKDFAFN